MRGSYPIFSFKRFLVLSHNFVTNLRMLFPVIQGYDKHNTHTHIAYTDDSYLAVNTLSNDMMMLTNEKMVSHTCIYKCSSSPKPTNACVNSYGIVSVGF